MNPVLPTFIIPGAGKSGTSYLAEVLRQHPEIFMPLWKEPAFFSTFKGRGFYHKGLPFYYRHFKDYAGEKEIGEASTVYMYDPESPRLLKKHLGDISLIFLLRNPVDRVYSNYWQEIKAGRKLPDFAGFLRSGSDRLQEMIYVSRYDLHLERYFSMFDKKKILIKFYDEIRSDPRKFIDDVTRFLGVTPLSSDVDLDIRVNPFTIPVIPFASRALRHRSLRQSVKAAIPVPFMKTVTRMVRIFGRNFNRVHTYPQMDGESRHMLAERLNPSVIALEKELNVDLSHWLL